MILTLTLVDWVKQIVLFNVGGPYPISWRPEQNKKAHPPWGSMNFSWLTTFKLGHWLFSYFGFKLKDQCILNPKTEGLQCKTTPSALLGLQLASSPHRSLDLSAPITVWASSLPHTHKHSIGSGSLQNPNKYKY